MYHVHVRYLSTDTNVQKTHMETQATILMRPHVNHAQKKVVRITSAQQIFQNAICLQAANSAIYLVYIYFPRIVIGPNKKNNICPSKDGFFIANKIPPNEGGVFSYSVLLCGILGKPATHVFNTKEQCRRQCECPEKTCQHTTNHNRAH